MQEAAVQFLRREDPLEKGQATHSRILGLPWCLRWQRTCLQCGRPRFDPWVGKIPLEKGMGIHSSIVAWRIPWTEEPGSLVRGVAKESERRSD